MLWWTFVICLCAAVVTSEDDKGEWKEVMIEQGTVRGRRDSNGELWTFLDVPYATAPTGAHKYKAPLPPPKWTEPYDAINRNIVCPQFEHHPFLPKEFDMQENCLVANIYLPDTEKKDLSVLVYVHGGSFQIGYGDMLKMKNYMKYKDFIVVTFNYRLGIHGFLCLGTEDVPGNAGMKDQLALLRWVKKNIAAFGGNPDDVTLAGGSAGSASVDLLMISKSAEGLFQKVIPESGASLAVFTVQSDPLHNAKEYAKELNFTNVGDIYALEEFYKSLSDESFTAAATLDKTDSTFSFTPCIERKTSEGAFLTESPLNILKRGDYKKLPLLYGFTNMEGQLRLNLFDVWKDRMNEKFSDFLPGDLKFENEAEKKYVAEQVKEFYFSDKPVSEDTVLSYVDYFSDVCFVYSTLRAVKLHVEAGHDQVYLYEYSFVDDDTPVPHTNVRGANHCDQSMAIFDGKNFTHMVEEDSSDDLKKMKKIIREFWHNFVITGKPVPEESSLPAWPPTGANGSPHMSLGQRVELRGALLQKRIQFWDGIYQKYYKEPIPPPTLPPRKSIAASEDGKGEWKEVTIEQGILRGRRDSSGELWTFLNVPYAMAPTNENKFKAPLPPHKWKEPYDAINRNIVCPQFKHHPLLPENYVMQEDCLVANVYVPDTEKKDLSVLVFVHGGGFQILYGDMMKRKNFMKYKDFIVITFNYRLGIHGFLCLGTEDVPGNAGIKDQVALLRWVQSNVAAFGGNPDDVTIAGASAGSASVDLLMISKSAEGLFHKVIPESGSNLAAFTVQSDPLYNAKEHAKTLKFMNVDNIYALEEFYKSLSYDVLTAEPFIDKTDSTFVFSPCIEREAEGAFLTESPLNILKRGDYKKLPLLYGFANMEGLIRIDFFEMWKNRMNEKFSDFLPADLKFENETEKEEVSKQIKEFYFGDKPVANDTVLGYVDYFSDVFFVYSTLRAVKLHAEAGHNQVYLYEYSFVDDDVPVVPHTNIRGANHCAQSLAVVDAKNFTHMAEKDLSEDFKRIKKTVREFWHNFVTTGNPVPEGSSLPAWPSAGANWSPHMSLGQKVELRGALSKERTLFWDGIYQKYYKEPIPPPQPPPRKNLVTSEEDKGEWKEVTIEQGTVRGRRDSSGELWTFFNVPYALAPTGENKFKAPLPPPKWTKPYEAINNNIVCPQFNQHPMFPENYVMQENCLVANVYVPDTKKNNLSVLVYVHGGAFVIGYGEMFKMKHYMKYKDFIVVTFNYRLGIHGFLCLGIEDAPGNAGMKDQVALLHWVQKNIAAFGGNPDDVTIAGGSAGSASVDLLMISKFAEGLFHRVIPESGANLAVFTIQSDPLHNAKEHAKKLGFTNVDNIYALADFYKSLSYDVLTAEPFIDRTDSTFVFSPCIEREAEGAFLTESPLNILKRGDYKKIPLLYGFANMEGLLRIDFFEIWKNRMNEKFSDFLPADLTFETKDEREKVAQQIKEFYFGDKPVGDDTVLGYVDYFSDVFFVYSILKAVKLHAEAGHNQVYLYEYSFVDEETPVVPHTNVRGAFHCAQSMAIADGKNFTHMVEEDSSEQLKKMKTTIREFWHNFVTTGNPVPKGSSLPAWPSAGVNCSPHMSFGQKVELRGVLYEERTRFWDGIYQRYYKEPIPPPQLPSRSHTEL